MNNEEDHVFVSRHGHRTTIDDGAVVEPIVSTATVVMKSKKVKQVRHHRTLGKKFWLGVLIVVVLIVAAPLISGEIVRGLYIRSQADAKTNLTRLVNATVLPQQKNTSLKASDVATTVSSLETLRDKTCQGGFLDNMAELYPRARQAHDDCIVTRSQINSLASSLKDLQGMIAYLSTLNDALIPVTTPLTEHYAVLASQRDNWQTFQATLKTMQPPAALTSEHALLATHAKNISEAWLKTVNATKAQSTSDFLAAERTLITEYAALHDVATTLNAQIDAQQQLVITAYVSVR